MMEIKSMTSNEISKPSASENQSFNPDKRIDVNQKQDTKESPGYDVDKRVETHSDESSVGERIEKSKTAEVGTTPDERKAFANHSDGEWSGEPGDSSFTPNSEFAKEKLSDYGQDCIEYEEGNPDFSKCSESTVEIEDMSSDRASNFRQADTACAKQWNAEARDDRTDWSAKDVKEWRQENMCSWHERIDMKTMDLVPREIHEECKHYGGVAECKRYETLAAFGGGFDE